MATLRRLLLIGALLGSVLGGYVFSAAGSTAHHAAPTQQMTDECGGGGIPC